MQTATSIGFLSVHPHKDPLNTHFANLVADHETRQMSSLEDVAQVMITRSWASCLWRDGYANNENFIEAWGIALDIDEGMPIKMASAALANFDHVIATTKSHQKPKKGIVADRYRIYLPTFGPITDQSIYRETASHWSSLLRGDRTKTAPGSHFLPGISLYEITETGRRIVPKKPPERVRYFGPTKQPTEERIRIAHQIMTKPDSYGGRNNTCYRAAHRLVEAGLTPDQAVGFMRQRTDLPLSEIEYIVRKVWKTNN